MGKKEDARGIEDTLTELELETDLSAEETAAAAVEAVTVAPADADKEPAAGEGADEAEEGDEEEEDEDEDEDEDFDPSMIPAPSDRWRNTGGEQPEPKRRGRPPGRPPKNRPPPDNDPPLLPAARGGGADMPLPDEPLGLVPPPRIAKGKMRDKSPVAGKMGKGLADKVPGAEKVQVFKREQGRRWFISDYTKDDLQLFPDFETFLTRYVKPDHGPGEYDLVGVDAHNRQIELGQVRLAATPKDHPDNTAMSVLQEMLKQNQQRDAEYVKRMEQMNKPQAQPDVLGLLNGVMTLQQKITEGAKEEKAAAAAETSSGMSAAMQAMMSSGDRTMQMMMAMMQQSQAASDRQNQLMMTILSKPKEEDPVMKLLLMKLMEDKDSGGSSAPIPPPPAPQGNNTVELITALAGFMAAMGGGGNSEGGDDFKEFLKQMLLQKQGEGISPKEMIELLTNKGGKDTFREAVDNMAAIMNISNNVSRQSEGGPAAGLFDALAALFSNRDFAGSIAQTIRAKTGAAQPPQQLTPEQRMMLEQRRRAAIAAGQVPQQLPASPPPQQQQQRPMPAQVTAPPPPPQRVPSEEVQRAAERVAARSGKLPVLPANTYEHISNLANAADEADLVGKTITMLLYFAEFADWRQFSETVLGLARAGNKAATLEYLTAFFGGLAEIHMIDANLAKKVLAALDKHFDAVKAQLDDLELDKDKHVTGGDLLGEPAAVGPAAQ
jgi:hypothetical protein